MDLGDVRLSNAEYTLLERKAAALDWLEAHQYEILRLGYSSGAIWIKKGQTLWEVVEAAMKAEAEQK